MRTIESIAPLCTIHPTAEINAYCATCNLLICSNCGLKDHKRHDVDLLEDIDEKHRHQLKETVFTIKNSVKEWEDHCHTQDDSLQRELALIEQKKQELLQSANATFDTLISIVHRRHEEIIEKIIDVSSAKNNLVFKLQGLKFHAKGELEQFEQIDTLPTIDIMQMKINQLTSLYQSIAEMRSCFDNQTIESLHTFSLSNVVPQADMISMSVQKLGEVIGFQPQNSPVQIMTNTSPVQKPYDPNAAKKECSPVIVSYMVNLVIKVKMLSGGLVHKVKLDKFTNLEELKIHLRSVFKTQEDLILLDMINGLTFPVSNIQELKNREECYYVVPSKNSFK